MFIGHIPAVGKQALARSGSDSTCDPGYFGFCSACKYGSAPKASILWAEVIMRKQKKLWEVVPGC